MTELRIAGDGALEPALALSSARGRAFRWEGFRRRGQPAGFRESETAAIRLFAAISGASYEGGRLGDTDLEFVPGELQPGSHRVELGGGVSLLALVRWAALPLARAEAGSELVALGTTHAPDGDTFEVSRTTWVHLMRRLGCELTLELERAGFSPRGGGEVRLAIASALSRPAEGVPLDLGEKGSLESVQIVSAASSLPTHVHQRQAARARSGIGIAGVVPSVQLMKLKAEGSGSTVAITGIFDGLPLSVAAVSQRGKSAEVVGERAASEFRRLFASSAVLPPVLFGSTFVAAALLGRGAHLTTPLLPPSVPHLAELVRSFLEREVSVEGKPGRPGAVRVLQ